MTTRTAQPAQTARELEAQLDEYPDERGEILIEAADAWSRAGDHDRAIELLTEATSLGGEDGGNARVSLADTLFDLGRADEAQAQLDTLRAERPTSAMPCHLAAELLEERGDHAQALTWFTMAVSRLSDEELAARDGDFGTFSYAGQLIAGRRRVRQALELPADELDDSVPDLDGALADKFDELLGRRANGPHRPREMRVLFWPRNEIGHAHRLWPQIVEHADVDAIIADREAANRELSETGIGQITMVPLTAARLAEFADRTGRDPADEATRLACMAEIVDEGHVISWPPARNAPCWCGSGVKYKKCCGRPGRAPAPTSMQLVDRGDGVVAVPDDELPSLSADQVRDTVERVRR